MKLIPKLYLSFGILLAIALSSALIATWSSRQAASDIVRTQYAHRVYEGYLALSNDTYQLFKQFADAMLIGDRDRGAMETVLVAKIRGHISSVRRLIGEEIDLVGNEEIEELEDLEEIETQIESLLAEYTYLVENSNTEAFPTDWWRLSQVLTEKVDRDFNALIQEVLDHEAEEVRETNEETSRRLLLLNMLAWLFGALAVVAAVASLVLLVRDIRGPIAELLGGAKALAAGKLGHRIDAAGPGELADVGRAFNSMADQISSREKALSDANASLERAVDSRTSELRRVLDQLRTNESNRRRLLADVSHELRTPLTIIQGEADIALRGGDKPPEVYREALEKSRDAAKHTARLVDDLLFIARREAGESRLSLAETDLAKLLPELADENRSIANGHGGMVVLVSDIAEAMVRCDRDRVRQVVLVLLENAFRYGAGRVEIRLHSAPNGYAIAMTDDGPGMTEEDQARAFDRFYRGSNAAEHYREGAGLGLPVAKAIIEAHGGTMTLKSDPGEGVCVSFTLPTRPRLEAVS